jgi:hypothetical protein
VATWGAKLPEGRWNFFRRPFRFDTGFSYSNDLKRWARLGMLKGLGRLQRPGVIVDPDYDTPVHLPLDYFQYS